MVISVQVTEAHEAFRSAFREATATVERLVDAGEVARAAGLGLVLSLLHTEAFQWGVPSDEVFVQLTGDVWTAVASALAEDRRRDEQIYRQDARS